MATADLIRVSTSGLGIGRSNTVPKSLLRGGRTGV